MKRIIIVIAATIGLIVAGTAGYAATTKPTYAAPVNTTVAFQTDTTAEVVHSASPYADFFAVRISRNSDMSNSRHVKSQEVGVNGHSIEGLTPGTKYYVQAYVTNHSGVRLSAYSNKASFRTFTEPPAE
jgi:hypothetical protein